MKEYRVLFYLLIAAFVVLCTEMVSCEWHADNLTHGCQTHWAECFGKKP